LSEFSDKIFDPKFSKNIPKKRILLVSFNSDFLRKYGNFPGSEEYNSLWVIQSISHKNLEKGLRESSNFKIFPITFQ